jgi:hypothetical protein
MGFYNNVILPRLCDLAMRNKHMWPYRERVIGAAEVLVDDPLAIFLGELAQLGRQQIEHGFRRTAEPHAFRRNHNRPVDENRMLHHRIEQLMV